MTLNIRVITPDRIICSTTADEIILPSLTGQIGNLEGHASLITALDVGLLRIKFEQKWTPIILLGGFAEVDRNQVTVLVNDVEEAPTIKLTNTAEELEKAFAAIENAETSKDKFEAAQNLKIASARVQALTFLA